MTNPQAMKVLVDLESHYAKLLKGVRDLIAAEQGGSSPVATDATKLNGAFASLTKADAAEQILQERGKLRTQDLFDAMKIRGHPVKNKESLYQLLDSNKRFKRYKRGIWTLTTPK
jgi:hypothetical protein